MRVNFICFNLLLGEKMEAINIYIYEGKRRY